MALRRRQSDPSITKSESDREAITNVGLGEITADDTLDQPVLEREGSLTDLNVNEALDTFDVSRRPSEQHLGSTEDLEDPRL